MCNSILKPSTLQGQAVKHRTPTYLRIKCVIIIVLTQLDASPGHLRRFIQISPVISLKQTLVSAPIKTAFSNFSVLGNFTDFRLARCNWVSVESMLMVAAVFVSPFPAHFRVESKPIPWIQLILKHFRVHISMNWPLKSGTLIFALTFAHHTTCSI